MIYILYQPSRGPDTVVASTRIGDLPWISSR